MTEIEKIDLFNGLGEDALETIRRTVVVSRHTQHSTILRGQDSTTDLCLILAGEVSVKGFSTEGQEVTFLRLATGQYFGEFAAIDGETRSADVVAVTPVVIGRISAANLQGLLLAHPMLGLNLIRHLVRKIRGLSSRVFEFSVFPVPLRIRKSLLRLSEDIAFTGGEQVLRPAPTHFEIATLTSTHREAVSRELARLASQGVIRVGRQTITILDRQRLSELAEEER